ncbi:response regulator [Asticcacaulis solisilvae]|uniref:response regulator n=1 Tax=Asticcacaulis solisilvae TaxID=1217274 RepID=UPI003FD7E3A8
MSVGSVLVLDANGAQAQHISKMLEREKWSAILAFDQKMALSMMRATRFHLLMVDAYVGQASMLAMIPEIRERAPATPLTIMTDNVYGRHAVDITMDQAKSAGAEFILQKPFSVERLKGLLKDTTRFHRERRSTKHLLVVEDNANLRTMIGKVLGEMGYQISLAENMEEAFARVDLDMVDLVVNDIFMPGMGGIEGIMKIRQGWPHIHILAMSAGKDEKMDANKVLAASRHVGAVEHLAKPFHMSDLIHLVAKTLGKVEPEDAVRAG